MIKASDEQELVVNHIKSGYNIVTDAVAGAGKTTLILLLALTFRDKKFIQVTYNSQLKLEVRRKAEQYGLDNIEIHTFHSMAVAFYDPSALTDIGIRRIIECDRAPVKTLPKCDIFVIDEAQDMTFLYYKFIKKFLKDLGAQVQQLIVGDTFQGIYTFKGADTRFLSLAHKLWFTEELVKQTTMNTSYRITHEISQFVNEILIGSDRVRALKSGPQIEYLKWDIWQVHNFLVPEILDLIRGGVRPEEIFILAGSVKSPRSPIKRLENALVMHGIKCYVPMADDKKIDDDVISGKVIFTTFHQAKGRERRVVIIYGFDASYYDYYARDEPRDRCPSTLYVAATRALEKLIIVEDVRKDPLPFLKSSLDNKSYINWRKEIVTPRKKVSEPPERILNPSDLVKFLREDILSLVTTQVDSMFENVSGELLQLPEVPSKVDCDDTFEEISDITGLAIITMFGDRRTGRQQLVEALMTEPLDKVEHEFLMGEIKKISKSCVEISDYLYLCNIYIAVKEKLYFRLAQMKNYNWLSEEVVTGCHQFMSKWLATDFVHQGEIGISDDKGRSMFNYDSPEYGRIKIRATVDGWDSQTVWMLKYVDDIQIEHQLQVVVWAWMWESCMKDRFGAREFKIMNIKTGQIFKLKSFKGVDALVQILLKNMFDKGSLKTDGEFLACCK